MEEFHQVVGKKVAEQWKLPEAVKLACMHYLEPEKAESHLKEVRITFLAHEFADFIFEDPDEEQIEFLATHPSTIALRISVKHLKTLVERLEKVRSLLEAMSLV